MTQGLFRKVALDRLSSPEQLDRLITVTTTRSWFALLAIACILLTSVLWGVFGSIPTKVYGQGVIANSFGIYNIVSGDSGQISDIRVVVGDHVNKGEVVARINHPQLAEQINDLKIELEQLKKLDENGIKEGNDKNIGSELADLFSLTQKITEAKAALINAEVDYENAISGLSYDIQMADNSLEQARVSEQGKKSYLDKMTSLYQSGAVSKNDYENAKRDYDLQRMLVQSAEQNLSKLTAGQWQDTIIKYRQNLEQAQLSLQMLKEQFATTKATRIAEAEDEVKKLQNKLITSSEIAAQVDGRVVEIKVNRGDIVQSGTCLVSMDREGSTIKQEAVLYVSAEEGKKILPGMEALISPSTVKKEQYGYILGRVTSISEYPATSQDMMHTLGNEGLVTKLAGEGASLEMHVDITVDASTVSGFKWTSTGGPPQKINSGILCEGSVTINKEHPIGMVIPTLKRVLSIY
ncbi:secretion protein HlyD family protein [Desulfofarcimen acetoxidans DSM 771]|uniref:Secretion protein HlyD family protein n=1 Tax=Desulfofarcimen acetoxidans (strain ATCC 49208 / DSM 771 / KCTC 5769 / VKM B-1644 / 5575) TaxID=485916 RepID=C8W364_DESAS|nr:NHLP bacteriocin system secretion protein [Desulfofarcimen acetoxidans]ACV61831.1 secretion protein HlyD family protein [Desulfofarcimen acetoxidans DSM 771]